jgi:hypothetical protein
LSYLAEKYADEFDRVAEVKRDLKAIQTMGTIATEAMARSTKLTDRKLSEARAYAGNVAKFEMEIDVTTLEQLGKGPEPIFGTYIYHGEGKLVEKCKYWTTDVGEDMEHALEHQYAQLIEQGIQNDNPLTCLPCVDYWSPGNETGITCILGGNHGDVAFRFHWMFRFLSLQRRKELGDLSHDCPILQTGFVECKKDKFEILEKTVTKPLEDARERLIQSCALVAHSVTDLFIIKCCLIPNEIDMTTASLQISPVGVGKRIKYRCVPGRCKQQQKCNPTQLHIKELSEVFNDVELTELRVAKSVSKFNDYYFGDLEFLANMIGMLD